MTPYATEATIGLCPDEGVRTVTVRMSDGTQQVFSYSSDWTLDEITGRLMVQWALKRNCIREIAHVPSP